VKIRRLTARVPRAVYEIGILCPELCTVPGQPFESFRDFEDAIVDQILLVAYEGRIPVGFCRCIVWKRFGCIEYVAVHPDHRRKGYGTALAVEACRRLRKFGATLLYGWARQGSLELADKLGFRRGGNFTYVFRPTGVDP
jgi:GNAT superfamily N-acetyltransferase